MAKKPVSKQAASKKAAPKRPKASKPARRAPSQQPPGLPPAEVRTLRELFWQNVLREMLSGLVVASMKRHAQAGETLSPEEQALLDGRVGLVTRRGDRIPIASIVPVFAATAGSTPLQRAMSAAVEGTVFQVATPAGEVYTLPLHEVRGFHALSQELMQQLAGEDPEGNAQHDTPFGFAAFTSLARSASHERGLSTDTPGSGHEGAD